VSSTEAYLDVDKPLGGAKTLRATIIAGPEAPLDQIELVGSEPDAVPMHAQRRWSNSEGNEPIAIALVINGQEIWIGNESFELDENARYAGMLPALERALDTLELANAMPAGSEGTVISYSTGAEIEVPLGPLARITGAALGRELDYKNKIGTDLVTGAELAMAELIKARQPRKAMIIIGDGTDTNNEAAKLLLADLKKTAATRGIKVYSITYKSPVSADESVIGVLDPRMKVVNSREGLAAALEDIVRTIGDRYYVEFDAGNEPWDGVQRDYTLRIGHDELEPISLELPRSHDHHRHVRRWIVQVGFGLGGLAMLLLVARLRYAMSLRAARES
jgi:hypothetical protein